MSKNEAKPKKQKYNPSMIELKWQSNWEKTRLYQPDLDNANKPFYNLMMFPYPSAEGMHVGNMYAFTGTDVYGRFKRMQGYDVLEPIGLDGFGIHSENYALKTGRHPVEQAKVSEENFYRQLHATGNGYDWSRTVETYKPEYYLWTQWIFVQLFKAGLAYRSKSPVNFCPSCKTVLADEQVIDGKCERCGSIVEKRELEQWFFRITKYSERLLENIKGLNWTEKVKIAQSQWIGKKEGINITYHIDGLPDKISVFTTRPDTNFGATFIALAPEHPFVKKIVSGNVKVSSGIKKHIEKYISISSGKSDRDREAEGREKTGVFTGIYALNPLTGYKMPVWVSDFVLMSFGTGALVGVPAHDRRDFEFARKFNLEVKRVVVGKDGDTSPITKIEQVQEKEGRMVNSDFLDGLDIHEATKKIMDYIEDKDYGKREVTYHLRDWLISRQRYWGPPIPMIHCQSCAEKGISWFGSSEARKKTEGMGNSNFQFPISNDDWNPAGWFPVPEDQLPVELPFIKDFKPLGTGTSPLGNHPEFYKVKCPGCGDEAKRETDVSDTFLDSAWYFLRYLATDRDDLPFPSEKLLQESEQKLDVRDWKLEKEVITSKLENQTSNIKTQSPFSNLQHQMTARSRFLPVTMYIGGAEHSVLHLLYSRFITMFFHDLGFISFEEPFARFYAHGLLIKEGAKMSKSKGNIIVPDKYIRKFGADTLRCYLMFLGPFNQGGDFYDTGIEGMNRFLKRVWVLFTGKTFTSISPSAAAKSFLNKTIKGVTEDIGELRYNTTIAKLMTYYNFLSKQENISCEEAEAFLKMLAPFAPHMTEEIWERMGKSGSIHKSSWPQFDERMIQEDIFIVAIQINGKLRATLKVSKANMNNQEDIEADAKADEHVAKFLNGVEIKKVIYVPGKVLNFVAG